MSEALDFRLPPTSPGAPAPVSAPAADELTMLRQKVAEQDQVIALAKTRVESLGAEKFEALEHVSRLEAQLEAAQRRIASLESPRSSDEQTLAELVERVAALEAVVVPGRVV